MRYLIVHTAPKRYIEKYQSSISGGNFSYNLKETGIFDKVYSILPSNIHGYNDELVIDGFEIVYSRLRGKHFILRILGCTIEQIKVFRKIERESVMWLYNVSILNVVLYRLLRMFKPSVTIGVILADFTPDEKLNDKFLRLINKSDGLITLSDSLLFTNVNRVVLPGIVPVNINYPLISGPIRKNFLISGALVEQISCISMLLEAFAEMPELELNISGRFRDPDKMKGYTDYHPNIKYHGVVSFDDFKDLLNSNTFILSTRDPSFSENQCNFPSKILEALLHNRVIVSSIHYPQLEGMKYFEVPIDKEGFKTAVKRIVSLPEDELMQYANQSQLAMDKFSAKAWRNSIVKIEKISYNAKTK